MAHRMFDAKLKPGLTRDRVAVVYLIGPLLLVHTAWAAAWRLFAPKPFRRASRRLCQWIEVIDLILRPRTHVRGIDWLVTAAAVERAQSQVLAEVERLERKRRQLTERSAPS